MEIKEVVLSEKENSADFLSIIEQALLESSDTLVFIDRNLYSNWKNHFDPQRWNLSYAEKELGWQVADDSGEVVYRFSIMSVSKEYVQLARFVSREIKYLCYSAELQQLLLIKP